MENITHIDLCAGTGFSTFACQELNINTIFANDFDSSSEQIFKYNFPNINFNNSDINNLDLSEIPNATILTIGSPYQCWSIAGDKLGFDDSRSDVINTLFKILKYKDIKVIVFENVKNLISHDNGKSFNFILESFGNLDYKYVWKIISTEKITHIPQHRERLYLVLWKDNILKNNFNIDFKEKELFNISNILEENINKKYYYTNKFKCYDIIKKNVIKQNILYQYRRTFIRENKSNLCPTLTANMGTGGHNVPLILTSNGIRKLTPFECFKFQGIPDNYKILYQLSDSKLYKLAGNAMTYTVIYKILKRIKNNLNM